VDYKVSVNKQVATNCYPIPIVDEILFTLGSNKKFFSKLDLSNAYFQILLDEESSIITTINTHKGLFRFLRLPFGIRSAPFIFQETIEKSIAGLEGVAAYLDDIIVTGDSRQDHIVKLRALFDRFRKLGVKLKREKCSFFCESLEFLGHVLSTEGVQPSGEKIRAIESMPAPKNVAELQSFLGMVTYYCKFIKNLSSKAYSLYKLLRKDYPWKWEAIHEDCFKSLKSVISASTNLAHYSNTEKLVLACDASRKGLGAVLSHEYIDGTKRAIFFASRSLKPAETNYAQIELEALAIIFAVIKFHKFLFGRHFLLQSDHRPLKYIFDSQKQLPDVTSARLQRWSIILAAYHYDIRYIPSKAIGHADALSRLPLTANGVSESEATIFNITQISKLPVDHKTIKTETQKDPILAKVFYYVQNGWPKTEELVSELNPYAHKATEIVSEQGVLLWGIRVIIPITLRLKILAELHEVHFGIVKTKSLARLHVWWPGVDKEIETTINNCDECRKVAATPTRAVIHPWQWPGHPWDRIHLDILGPYTGKYFLVIQDAYSKWIDVKLLHSISSSCIIESLNDIFSYQGLPLLVVSDNGTQLASSEFGVYLKSLGVGHYKSSPHHQKTNGAAEICVGIIKKALKTGAGDDINKILSQFLLQYRSTPHTVTGETPAKLLLGRNLRTRLSLVHPDIQARIEKKQFIQKSYHDKTAQDLVIFATGVNVWFKPYTKNDKWQSGTILRKLTSTTYDISSNNKTYRRHIDDIQRKVIVDSDLNNMPLDMSPCVGLDRNECTASVENTPCSSNVLMRQSEPMNMESFGNGRYPNRIRAKKSFE
jgi:hypothetical protein